MKNSLDEYKQNKSHYEQYIYNHFLQLIDIESSEEIIERFRILFLNSSGYPDQKVAKALIKIIPLLQNQEEFNFILNRCCYIVINRERYIYKKDVLLDLIKLFDKISNKSMPPYYGSRNSKKLFDLVQTFTTSQQYLALKRLAEVINQEGRSYRNSHSALAQPLRTLIPRYPYLYQHCLITSDNSYEHQKAIRKIQRQEQKKFEIDLSHYVTYQIRHGIITTSELTQSSCQNLNKIQNPTLLNDRELLSAIKQFVGKVENGYNYQDYAKSFITYTKQIQSYSCFKDSFYQYLSTSFNADSRSFSYQFKNKLYKQLKNTMPHNNDKPFNDFLLMRTCDQILGFLVVESVQKPQHFLFLNLMSNIGPIATTCLLLKIVLVCHKVKPYLEKRFAILFNHYESSTRDGVIWLVKALENTQVALSTNFGKIDLSFLH
ncbi:hypothetical protein [Okeania sp.]|uniref:hypothetical protein n=1 Tax=Okeania sp. TaxID=3100323 RepID=UPI002B4B3074|nr:hypothetical protein [Okeania sp.]MEB3342648.1 hypothetical protein [Okeania sp.]